MTQFSGARIARNIEPGKYHPRCGEEHSGKPAKALIGIGLLVVLSFLLHEINGHMPASQVGVAQHANDP